MSLLPCTRATSSASCPQGLQLESHSKLAGRFKALAQWSNGQGLKFVSLGLENKEKRDKGGHSHSSSSKLPVQEGLVHILPVELCPELALSAWVLPTAPQGTDPKHQGTNCTPAGEPPVPGPGS